MSFDLAGLAKIVWILTCLSVGLWSATGVLHDKKLEKSFAGRFFLALIMVLFWVLIGLVTISIAKYIAIFVGIWVMILMGFYVIDRMRR